MADAVYSDRYHAYREAIRQRVCTVCLDSADDGSCRWSGVRACVVDTHLPQIVEAVEDVRSGRERAIGPAVERRVCRECPERGPDGACAPRENGRCAVVAYLPLIVRAIDDVDRMHRRA
jgi:hypothetical protein